MKKRGMLILFAIGLFGSSVFFGLWYTPASAAACANVSTFGAVNVPVPELSNIQDQAIWVRMQGQAGSKILVEVNGADCYEISLQDDSSNSWSWQTLQDGSSQRKISFSRPSDNTITLIGVSDGVRLDRVLIAEPDCVPQDYGNNCQSSVSVQTNNPQDEPTALASPSGPVSGEVHLSPTTQNEQSARIRSVVYRVNGQVIQQEDSAAPFDSTLLDNGRYTVHIISTMEDGAVMREMIAVDIENPENALTPFVRWAKRNQLALQSVGFGLLALAAGYVIYRFITDTRRKRRERTFRGL